MNFALRLAGVAALGLGLLGFAACDAKSPTAPLVSLQPGRIVNLTLVAPPNIAPLRSVQLVAQVTRPDGSVADVTSLAEWSISSATGDSVLSLSNTGVATARSHGEAVVAIGFEGRTAEATILVLPDGTFRLTGTVTENNAGLEGVRVAVMSGTGQGVETVTDSQGRYALYGVSGQLELWATKTGYEVTVDHVNVVSHAVHAMRMVPGGSRVNLTGRYTLTIVAAGTGEQCDFPDALKRRVYNAEVEQQANELKILLTGGNFIVDRDGSGNNFRGAVQPSGEITFWSRPTQPWDYDGPDIAERLDGLSRLYVAGIIAARFTPNGVTGIGDGASIIHHGPGGGWFGSTAGCPIVQFEMTRR